MRKAALAVVAAVGALAAGCAHAPQTMSGQTQLVDEARGTVRSMTARDPSLATVLAEGAGYVVFPKVTAAGLGVGGSGGGGVVFNPQGQPTGFAQLSGASAGAVAGGEQYAQIVAVRDPAAMQRLRSGAFDFGAEATGVIVKSGSGANTQFGNNGVAVYVQPAGGAMFSLSLTGQHIHFSGA